MTSPDTPDSPEADDILAAGAKAGNRAGALAFLALVVVLAAATYYYMTNNSGEYLQILDTELLRDAELSIDLRGNPRGAGAGGNVAVAPSWPLALHDKLLRDIALYAGAAAAAACLWALSARARARRDAAVLHNRLAAEIAALREKVEKLEAHK